MASDTLLIELLTEELPPKALKKLGESFAQQIVDGLKEAQFLEHRDAYHVFASPRRLGVLIKGVKNEQEDQQLLRKGPSVTAGLKDGVPTKALEGFARSCQTTVDALSVVNDGKQDVYAYEYTQVGRSLEDLIGDILALAVKKLPIPKVMRWGSSTHTFVRPVHGLIALHGETVLNTSVLGLKAGNSTLGHRFLSTNVIAVPHADQYEELMRHQGWVIPNFDERYEIINTALLAAADRLNAQISADDALLEEVTALVEWPEVFEAGFDTAFLNVPQECLILTMQQNQKYFPLLDLSGKLINRFLLVSNLRTDDPEPIISGNERVLRARLSDAEFFYQQDQKASLESRLPKLAQVVYHNKIGAQSERIDRLVRISEALAPLLRADKTLSARAARLAKADLVTDMVGEFPELQGIMGRYYAIHDGENTEVADAIAEHYQPRFAGDALPKTQIATTVALADKLESLVGIWGIGLIPTGDKDPYALRRAALGVIRMLLNQDVDIKDALNIAYQSFEGIALSPNTLDDVFDFIFARLTVMLNQEHEQDVVASVLALRPTRLNQVLAKIKAVSQFKALPEASALAAANKRVQNLLKKTEEDLGDVDESLLQEAAEKDLYFAARDMWPHIQTALQHQDFETALNRLATIKPKVDAFFDEVMVMVDNTLLKHNRLNLLNMLSQELNAVADIALLTHEG